MSAEAADMLGELESHDLDAVAPGRAAWLRARALPAGLRAHAVLVALAGLVAVSTALRIALGTEIHGPFVAMDELGYEQLAKSLAQTGHLALFGQTGLSYSPLYPILLSPIYALTSSAHVAYEWAKVENAVLMSLSVFPVYGIARFVLSRGRSVGVAALSLAAPLMFYSSLEMSESLAYPLFLVAVWAMLRALREPGVHNDALLLGSILLAGTARLQHVALFPAALTAILLVALVRPAPGERRLLSIVRAVGAHRLLFGTVAAGAAAILIRTAANGGALPLAGRYANVGGARANPLRVLEIAVHHLAELDFAIGVIPFAGALLAAYVLARSGFPRDGLVFGSVAVATTIWVVLEVAFDAAAFDTGLSRSSSGQVTGDLPRIHERYLIYLVPLFLVALVAALRAARPRVPTPAHLAIAAAAAALPATIPFSRVVNHTIVADSFGMQIFGTDVAGRVGAISHPAVVAVAVGGVFGLAYVYALARPRPSFAIVMTVVAFLLLSSLVRARLIGATTPTDNANRPAHVPWVDRVVDGGNVVVVGGKGARKSALLGTAFDNLSVSRVYYTCTPVFGSDFGEHQATLDASGNLQTTSGPLRARYAVVPAAFDVRGRVLARDISGGLVLVAPEGSVLTVPAARRSAVSCGG